MEHLRQLPACEETVLILAGDLACNIETIESSLRLLQQKFGAVFYVPGNHELWINKSDGLSSIHKFIAIIELCERLGIHTRPAFISEECAVCPLFSWYKENLFDGFTREKFDMPFDTQTMWPWDITGSGDTNDAQQSEIADFFQRLNSRRVSTAPATAVEALRQAEAEWKILQEGQTVSSRRANKKVHNKAPTVISMSHFVPRQECYPGPRRLCGVMGCREIETQIRNLGATCHVFGHSHIACDRMLDAIRYLQHPLGYPTDYHRKVKPIRAFGGDAISHAVDISKAPLATVGKLILQEIARDPGKLREPARTSTRKVDAW